LMDNNLDSYWAISGAPPFAWAQLDLGKDKQLSEIRYFVLGEGHAEHTRVEYSSDGKNWKTFSNATDLNTGLNWGWHSIATGKITARYVRFFIENPGTATWTLGFYSEMQVWGN